MLGPDVMGAREGRGWPRRRDRAGYIGDTVGSLWERDWATKKQDQAQGLPQSFFRGWL